MNNTTFKTFVFEEQMFPDIINYAQPVERKKKQKEIHNEWLYEWAVNPIPLLYSIETTIKDFKKIYKGLDFDKVELIIVKVTK